MYREDSRLHNRLHVAVSPQTQTEQMAPIRVLQKHFLAWRFLCKLCSDQHVSTIFTKVATPHDKTLSLSYNEQLSLVAIVLYWCNFPDRCAIQIIWHLLHHYIWCVSVFFIHYFWFCNLFLVPHSLINADFCCAGSLIAYGALLGKVSPVQLMVVTLFGVTLFAVEEYIILSLLHVSITWHNHHTEDLTIVQWVK